MWSIMSLKNTNKHRSDQNPNTAEASQTSGWHHGSNVHLPMGAVAFWSLVLAMSLPDYHCRPQQRTSLHPAKNESWRWSFGALYRCCHIWLDVSDWFQAFRPLAVSYLHKTGILFLAYSYKKSNVSFIAFPVLNNNSKCHETSLITSLVLSTSLLCFAALWRPCIPLVSRAQPLRHGWWLDSFSQPWFIIIRSLALSVGLSGIISRSYPHIHRCALSTVLRNNQW